MGKPWAESDARVDARGAIVHVCRECEQLRKSFYFDATFGKNVANRPGIIEMAAARSYNDIQEDGDGNHSSFHRRFYAFSDNKKMRKQWRV